MSTTSNITIEQLEALANEAESTENAERNRLMRLTRAYARIIAAREPAKFKRLACEYSDEDGHWDNSYPPAQQYKDRTGPRAVLIAGPAWDEVATSHGFYYSWRASQTASGLAVTRDGEFIGAEIEGTGHFGQYAAHPGTDDVMITLTWDTLSEEDLPTDALRAAEAKIRDIAFPLIAAKKEN